MRPCPRLVCGSAKFSLCGKVDTLRDRDAITPISRLVGGDELVQEVVVVLVQNILLPAFAKEHNHRPTPPLKDVKSASDEDRNVDSNAAYA